VPLVSGEPNTITAADGYKLSKRSVAWAPPTLPTS